MVKILCVFELGLQNLIKNWLIFLLRMATATITRMNWVGGRERKTTSIDSNNKDITFYGILSVQKAKIRAFSLGFVYIFTITTCIECLMKEKEKKKTKKRMVGISLLGV